jgi:hypothetical protein
MPKFKFEGEPVQNGAKAHLKDLFLSGKHADATIRASGKEFKVHKIVLSRSEVFERMLSGEAKEAQSGVITIKDIKHEVLEDFLLFLYCDETPNIKEYAVELMLAADKYMVKDLVKRCAQYLMININTENYDDIIITADKLHEEALRENAIDFVIA